MNTEKRRICWNITTKCNQNCNYCFGFKNLKELSYEDNKKVLDKLLKGGINRITWTGGESVLYPELNKLIKISKDNGAFNRIVTNGIYLANNDNDFIDDLFDNVDEIDISIDSVDNEVNEKLGRGYNHLEDVEKLLEKLKGRNIRIGINTVVSRLTYDKLEDLGEFLNQYDIYMWKFLKFMPIREVAKKNEKEFEIDDETLEEKINELSHFDNITKIMYRRPRKFEETFVMLPNSDLVKTINGVDYYVGNVLKEDEIDFNKLYKDEEIRVVVALEDEQKIKKISNFLSNTTFVKVVGTATTGNDTYKKIIDLKPEMVFVDFDMPDMNANEIIRKSKKVLNEDVPIFNFITKSISRENFFEAKEMIGDKLNTIIHTETQERFDKIITDYSQYMMENK